PMSTMLPNSSGKSMFCCRMYTASSNRPSRGGGGGWVSISDISLHTERTSACVHPPTANTWKRKASEGRIHDASTACRAARNACPSPVDTRAHSPTSTPDRRGNGLEKPGSHPLYQLDSVENGQQRS